MSPWSHATTKQDHARFADPEQHTIDKYTKDQWTYMLWVYSAVVTSLKSRMRTLTMK